MNIKSLFKKIITVAAMVTMFASVEAFAAPTSINNAAEFPFEVELDTDSCDRLCYAGHSSSGVKYAEGLAVTPYTQFKVVNSSANHADIANLDIEIYILYENDKNTGSLKEVIKKYSGKDIKEDEEYYDLFSENLRNSLGDRNRLYSNSLRSLVIKLTYNGRDKKVLKKYFNVCSEEEFYELISYADEDETEAVAVKKEFLEL